MFKNLIFISFLFSLFTLILRNILISKSINNIHKLSAFECGFQSFSKLHFSFSLRFFIVALIFLIFDIEIIFVFPFSIIKLTNISSLFSFIILVFFIFYGLIHEWYFGSLDWSL